MKYVIAWKDLVTGETGRGTATFDCATAQEACNYMNDQLRGKVRHWPEPVQDTNNDLVS